MDHRDAAPYTTRPWPLVRTAIVNGLRLHRPLTLYGLTELDVTRPVERFAELRRTHRIAVSLTAHLAWCQAHMLTRHPGLNTFRRGKQLLTFHDIDVAVAMDRRLPDGTRYAGAGTVRAAQRLSPAELALELRRLTRADPTASPEVRRRRRFAALPSWLQRVLLWRIARDPEALRQIYGTTGLSAVGSGATATASLHVIAPNPFTLAILASPMVRTPQADGGFACRVPVTMAMDHAIMDGADAAAALVTLADLYASADMWTDAEAEKLVAHARHAP